MKNIINTIKNRVPLQIGVAITLVFISFVLVMLSHAKVVLPAGLDLYFVHVNFYGICIVVGILAVGNFVENYLQLKLKRHIDITNDLIVLVIAALVGARLFHVISDWNALYANNPIKALFVWEGGLSLFGALVFGAATLVWVARRNKISYLQLINFIILFLPLGQIIGRYGNFFNQELYGHPTQLPWGIFIQSSHRPELYFNDQFFHPVFWYEQILNTILLAVLWYFATREHKGGIWYVMSQSLIFIYMIGYGTIRYGMELLRLDPPWFLGLSFGKFLAIVAIFAGIIMLIINYYRLTKLSANSITAHA